MATLLPSGQLAPSTMPAHNGIRLLALIQERHPKYHPALALADLAHNSEDEEIQFKCHATLLKVVEPELKAMQIEQEIRETRTIRVSLFESIDVEEIKSVTEERAKVLPSVVEAEVISEVYAE